MALIAEGVDLRAGYVFLSVMGGLLVLLGVAVMLRLRRAPAGR
jgi:hypothetical protein